MVGRFSGALARDAAVSKLGRGVLAMAKLGLFSVVLAAAVLGGAIGCNSAGGTMTILDVQPKLGPTTGEQPVRIIGQNFRTDIGYTVYFGTKKTESVTIRDPETLDVVTPPSMPVGKADIMIRSDDGSAFRIKEGFSFEDMSPGSNPTGTTEEEKKGNLAY